MYSPDLEMVGYDYIIEAFSLKAEESGSRMATSEQVLEAELVSTDPLNS